MQVFTYADLKSEVPFISSIVVINLPGSVIADALQFSRQPALSIPPVEKGGYLQCDDEITWDRGTNAVLAIAGEPMNPEKIYSVAIAQQLLDGLDSNLPLLEYKATHSELNVHADAGMGLKEIIVAHFAKVLWADMIRSLNFSALDTDGNGFISREELLEAAKHKYNEVDHVGDPSSEISSLLVDNLFRVADSNSDGLLSKSELVSLALNSLRSLKIQKSGAPKRKQSDSFKMTVSEAKESLRDLLGPSLEDESDRGERMLREILDAVDVDHNGYITQYELEEHLRKVARSDSSKVKI
jgi:Ca2+-binding EF-hand superfamily protein